MLLMQCIECAISPHNRIHFFKYNVFLVVVGERHIFAGEKSQEECKHQNRFN